ncbi:MAG: histidine kinase, partial [Mesorhizobium sp.]
MASHLTPHLEAASTIAVIVSSNEPLLFLTDSLKVIAASASFCRAFEIDSALVPTGGNRAVPDLAGSGSA